MNLRGIKVAGLCVLWVMISQCTSRSDYVMPVSRLPSVTVTPTPPPPNNPSPSPNFSPVGNGFDIGLQTNVYSMKVFDTSLYMTLDQFILWVVDISNPITPNVTYSAGENLSTFANLNLGPIVVRDHFKKFTMAGRDMFTSGLKGTALISFQNFSVPLLTKFFPVQITGGILPADPNYVFADLIGFNQATATQNGQVLAFTERDGVKKIVYNATDRTPYIAFTQAYGNGADANACCVSETALFTHPSTGVKYIVMARVNTFEMYTFDTNSLALVAKSYSDQIRPTWVGTTQNYIFFNSIGSNTLANGIYRVNGNWGAQAYYNINPTSIAKMAVRETSSGVFLYTIQLDSAGNQYLQIYRLN